MNVLPSRRFVVQSALQVSRRVCKVGRCRCLVATVRKQANLAIPRRRRDVAVCIHGDNFIIQIERLESVDFMPSKANGLVQDFVVVARGFVKRDSATLAHGAIDEILRVQVHRVR